jgi:hypothetical protein
MNIEARLQRLEERIDPENGTIQIVCEPEEYEAMTKKHPGKRIIFYPPKKPVGAPVDFDT